MEDVRLPKTCCYIRIIVNPRVPESFNIKHTLYPGKKIEVTIVTPNSPQLRAIVQEMKKNYGPANMAFDVKFNWTNAPKDIRNDAYIKTDLMRLFGGAANIRTLVTPEQFMKHQTSGELPRELGQSAPHIDIDNLEIFANRVRTHIVDYGAHPNMADRSEKGTKKICNYIKSVCAEPNMKCEIAIKIADMIYSSM